MHVTDHPAPDAKWLDHGGHHALDPFVALSFAAAATTDVKLLTNVYIAAYRNPFLGAKSIQSLDILSGGRLILGTAAGYLKPEFRALGIDFDSRGALLDEALDVLTKVLTGEDVAYEGTSFAARGVRLRPVPRPPPPIWVGGNSKPAVRRAVSRAQGWAPFNTFGYATASRTAEISTLDELESAIAWATKYAAEIGRTEPLDICFSAGNLLDDSKSTDERHATIEQTRGGRGHLADRRARGSRPSRIPRPRARVRRGVHRVADQSSGHEAVVGEGVHADHSVGEQPPRLRTGISTSR